MSIVEFYKKHEASSIDSTDRTELLAVETIGHAPLTTPVTLLVLQNAPVSMTLVLTKPSTSITI